MLNAEEYRALTPGTKLVDEHNNQFIFVGIDMADDFTILASLEVLHPDDYSTRWQNYSSGLCSERVEKRIEECPITVEGLNIYAVPPERYKENLRLAEPRKLSPEERVNAIYNPGDKVKIISDNNCHCIEINTIVTIEEQRGNHKNNLGTCYHIVDRSPVVRSIDMQPITISVDTAKEEPKEESNRRPTVGDKVKLLDAQESELEEGEEYFITRDDKDDRPYKLSSDSAGDSEDDYYFNESDIEFITDTEPEVDTKESTYKFKVGDKVRGKKGEYVFTNHESVCTVIKTKIKGFDDLRVKMEDGTIYGVQSSRIELIPDDELTTDKSEGFKDLPSPEQNIDTSKVFERIKESNSTFNIGERLILTYNDFSNVPKFKSLDTGEEAYSAWENLKYADDQSRPDLEPKETTESTPVETKEVEQTNFKTNTNTMSIYNNLQREEFFGKAKNVKAIKAMQSTLSNGIKTIDKARRDMYTMQDRMEDLARDFERALDHDNFVEVERLLAENKNVLQGTEVYLKNTIASLGEQVTKTPEEVAEQFFKR